MGARASLCAALSAVVLALAGCGADTGNDSSGIALDEYVKQSCAILIDFNDRFQKLLHDFAANNRNQTALADTVSAMGDLYDELLVKSQKLGDPPNHEGVAGDEEAEAAMKSAVSQFHDIASSIRAAKTDSDIAAAVDRLTDTATRMATQGAELKKKYPTPELDRAMKAIPGCNNTPGA
jgi:hypothetical protein